MSILPLAGFLGILLTAAPSLAAPPHPASVSGASGHPASLRIRADILQGSAGSAALRWSESSRKLSRSARAEKASSLDPDYGKWALSGLSLRQGELSVEHQGSDGAVAWSWTTVWDWPDDEPAPRLISARRAVASEDGSILADTADWSSGERVRAAHGGSLMACDFDASEPPEFSELSLAALFSGAYLPSCSPRDVAASDPPQP